MPSSEPFAVLRIRCRVGLIALGAACQMSAQFDPPQAPCTMDLRRVETLRDILSNALIRGMGRDELRVRKVLARAVVDAEDSVDLLHKTADAMKIERAALFEQVERLRHVNCRHGQDGVASPDSTAVPALTPFAANVTVHVVLHELGHALVREFDLPVFANEEVLADAFATHYLTTHLPGRALDVLRARIDSLMFEAREVPRHEWTVKGEHDSDARRAYQIAALALAADPDAFAPLARAVGMLDEEVRRARDYGSEIHRSWRRLLRPLRMPAGQESTEARVRFGGEGLSAQLGKSEVAVELESALRAFDWHSQVTLAFVEGEGGAGWSRSGRTITVHSAYVARFVEQGASIAAK